MLYILEEKIKGGGEEDTFFITKTEKTEVLAEKAASVVLIEPPV